MCEGVDEALLYVCVFCVCFFTNYKTDIKESRFNPPFNFDKFGRFLLAFDDYDVFFSLLCKVACDVSLIKKC